MLLARVSRVPLELKLISGLGLGLWGQGWTVILLRNQGGHKDTRPLNPNPNPNLNLNVNSIGTQEP